jgi:two-component system response regulator FlrC
MSYSGPSKTASPQTPDRDAQTRTAVLIVDDEPDAAQLNASVLLHAGFHCRTCASGAAALEILAHESKDVLVADVSMPGMDGIELARQVRARWPELSVILLTAKAEVEIAAAATQGSVLGYTKVPFHPPAFVDIVRRAAQMTADARHQKKIIEAARQHGIIAESPQMIAVLSTIARAAPSKAAVIIEGEHGTGKTMLAALLHGWSYRKTHPMVTLECSRFAAGFSESDLLGSADEPGPLERSMGGTLLLEEIAAASVEFHKTLLRVLQDGQFQPAGAPQPIDLDVRMVTTTNKMLRMEAAAGRFSKDLLRALGEIIVRVPPLRERPEAILPLARSIVESNNSNEAKQVVITPSAEQAMLAHDWPGNSDEMQTRLERALILSRGGEITPDLLGLDGAAQDRALAPAPQRGLGDSLDSLAAERVREAVEAAGGDDRAAARNLGINPAMMPRIRSRFGI